MHVVVIGGGLLGLTTAFSLSRHGLTVTLLEQLSAPGRATSFANGGMLHASQANPWNEPGVFWHALKMLGREDAALLVRFRALPSLLGWGLRFVRHSRPDRYLQNFEKNARLAGYSLDCMRELRAAVGSSYDYAARGTLKLFRSVDAVTGARTMCRQLSEWGIRFEVVDARRAIELEPALARIEGLIAGGLFFPDDESGDAQRFCELLATACVVRGVRIEYGVKVDRLLRSGDRVEGVLGSRGLQTADAYVLAAGPWSAPLASDIGLSLPLRPVKGYSLTLDTKGWAGRPTLPVIDDSLHAAVCPLGERLRVAGTAEFTGFDLKLTQGRINNLFSLVTQLYPDFAPHLDRDAALRWCGLRPMSADGVGLMGRTPLRNLFLNTGHGHLGWTLAAGAGQLVADLIAGQPPALDPAAYALARFR